VSLQITASDADGDPLTYSATNLPAGLSINAASGRITGTPTTAIVSSVTVTVADYRATSSVTFTFTVSSDTSAPSTPGTPSATIVSGKPNLSWSASTDNVGVAGYIIYRSTGGGSQGSEVGRSSGTTFRDESAGRRRYYYSVRAFDAAGNVSNRSSQRMVDLR
jgi:hypothetical protein